MKLNMRNPNFQTDSENLVSRRSEWPLSGQNGFLSIKGITLLTTKPKEL